MGTGQFVPTRATGFGAAAGQPALYPACKRGPRPGGVLVVTSGRPARIADTPIPPCNPATIHGSRAHIRNPTQITLLRRPMSAKTQRAAEAPVPVSQDSVRKFLTYPDVVLQSGTDCRGYF